MSKIVTPVRQLDDTLLCHRQLPESNLCAILAVMPKQCSTFPNLFIDVWSNLKILPTQ